jgi:outer membrane biosynthesis protein TonB
MDNLSEIVVFALLFLGWIVRTVLENRKKPPPRPVPPAERPAPEARPAPPPVPRRRERAPRHEPDPEAVEAERVEPAPKPTVAPPTVSGTVELVREFAPIPEVQGLAVGSLEATTAAIADESARHRRKMVRRLGGPEGASPRDLARAGVLWSEVLGPPRATSGPHRPPSPLRRRR